MTEQSATSNEINLGNNAGSVFVPPKPDNAGRPNLPMFIDPVADLKPQEGVMGDSWFLGCNLDADDREFGLQIHYVKKPIGPGMTTVALSDMATSRYLLDDGKDGNLTAAGDGFTVSSEDLTWSAEPGGMRVTGQIGSGEASFDLTIRRKGSVLLPYSGTGLFPLLDNELATYQFAFPLMDTVGTVTVDGQSYPVTGNSWFDRQWFKIAKAETLASGDTRWSWLSIQLSDDTIVAVWNATGKRERTWANILHPDGTLTVADVEQFSENLTGTWLSAESGVVWPSGWNVVIPGLNAKLTATYTFEGQETFANFHRLEGVIHVQGTFAGQDVTGRGYGELVGDPQIKTHK